MGISYIQMSNYGIKWNIYSIDIDIGIWPSYIAHYTTGLFVVDYNMDKISTIVSTFIPLIKVPSFSI